MKQSTFIKLARTVTANAAGYKTKRVCAIMCARVQQAWAACGGYGNFINDRDEAIWAIRFRWLELDGMERDAKYGHVLEVQL